MLTFKPEERISALEALKDQWLIKMTETHEKNYLEKGSINALSSLKNFKVRTKMQQAVMAYMAGHLQSKESEEKLKATFRSFDKNGDGQLEKSELIAGYMKLGMSHAAATKAVTKIMNAVDINKNGTIDYSEFLMANVKQEEMLAEEKLWEAFKVFDKVFSP